MALFGITRRKLEEGFGSLVGNVGQLFNNIGGAVNSVVQPAVRNVQQQVQPVANQVAQNWQQAQNASGSFGNTLRQQAQQLTNNAINATVKGADSFSDSLGYTRDERARDIDSLKHGDLSSLANPLMEGIKAGIKTTTNAAPIAVGLGTGQAVVDSAQGKQFDPMNRIDRAGDIPRGIAQQGVNAVANIPGSAAALGTWKSNNIDQPIARTLFGEDTANKFKELDERTARSLYDVSNKITGAGESMIEKTDKNSAYSRAGDIAGQVGIGLGARLPFWYTQALGRTGTEAYNATGDLGKASTTAMVYAPVEAALEKIGSARVLSPAGIDIAKGGLRQTAREAAKGFLSEGSTEAAQQFAENVTKNKVYNPQQGLMEGVPESFVIGGLVGGGLRGANTGGNYRAEKTAFQNQLDQELQNLNNTVTDPTSNINPEEQTQVSTPQQIQPQATQPIQTPQAPQAPQDSQLPQPVQQPQVTQPMSEVDTQQLQNTQADITRNQPLSGQPESASDLLNRYKVPEQNTQSQQALGEAQVQAQDLVSLYKLDPSTAQRLINDYGYDKVAGLAQEVSKSGTAKNVSAVVVSEAQKRWGKPRNQMTPEELASLDQTPEAQANMVSEQPTQTVPSEQQPILDAEAQAYVANTPQVGKTSPVENTPKTLYRGTTKREVDALLAGKQKPESLETNIFGETIPKNTLFVTDDINLAKNYSERAAVTRKPHLDGGYIIEYKNTANTKAQSSISKEAGSSVVQQNPNEFYAKDLTLDDVARITDKDGNVVYDASTPRQKPAPRQTDDIVKYGGQGAFYTDPKTGKQTYITEDELLEELIRLQSIPVAQRTVADATSLADIRKVLNKNRADANTTHPQVGKTGNVVDTSTGESMAKDQYIGKATQAMQTIIDTQILPKFEGQPFTVEQFTREIQQADRTGTNPSPAVAKFYSANIAPLVKGLAKNIGREDVLQRKWYLPQFRPGIDQKINVGGSLVNQIDVQDFGFSKARENAIPLEELDYTLDGLVRLATQEAAYKARHAIRAEEIVQTQADRGIEIAPKQAEKVARLEEQTAKDLNQRSQDRGQIEQTDLLGKMKQLGREQGEKQRIIYKGPWSLDRLTNDRNNLLSGVTYTDSSGVKSDIYHGMGFYLYDRADGVGHQLFSELFDVDKNDVITAKANTQDIVNHLQEEYKNTNLPQAVKDQMISDFAYSASNADTKTAADTSIIREAFTKLQKRMARELLTQELKTVDIRNKQLAKLLNNESRRVLMEDNFARSLGEKTINAITGTFYRGYLALNPRSAMMQLFEINRLQALLGPKQAGYGVAQAMKDVGITKRYGIRETRWEDVNEYKNSSNTKKGIQVKDQASNALMYLFNKGEQFKDAAFLHALEGKYKQQGLQGTELTRKVLDDFHKYAIKYGQEGSIGLNKSKTGRLLFQFMQFGIKSTRIRLSKAMDVVGPNKTTQTRREAGAYLARDAAGSAILYLALSAAIGATWEEVMGFFNPFEDRNNDKEKSTAESVVGRIPGGPFISNLKTLYFAMMQESRASQKEDRPYEPGKVLNTQVKKNIAALIPGGHQLINKTGVHSLLPDGTGFKEFFKDQGAIQDMQRGYNQSASGRARFKAPDTPQDIAKALIFGQYTTGPAREYFGSQNVAGDLDIAKKLGVDWIGPKDGYYPVGEKFQDRINKGEDVKTIIVKSREYDQKKKDFKQNNPAQQSILDEINKTVYNPATKKNESDVISPEKWDKVNSDQTLTLFERLRQKAIDDNREFGYEIDPIYKLTDKQQIKEILKIRSLPTGDDTELKQMNKAKHQWYRDFADAETKYYEAIKAKNFETSDDYGPTQRKKEYIESGSQYPQFSPLVKQYFDIKNKDANAGKEFYKANRDALANDFANNKKAVFEWTNNRRRLEGAQPLTWEAFNNVTFGYEDDESKVFKELGYKLGEFGSNYDKSYNAYRKAKSFSQPTIRIASPKPGALKVPKGKLTKASYKVPKIIVRRSKA